MTLKNKNFDETQKLNSQFVTILKTKSVTKKSSCDKAQMRQNSNCDKTQIVIKFKL